MPPKEFEIIRRVRLRTGLSCCVAGLFLIVAPALPAPPPPSQPIQVIVHPKIIGATTSDMVQNTTVAYQNHADDQMYSVVVDNGAPMDVGHNRLGQIQLPADSSGLIKVSVLTRGEDSATCQTEAVTMPVAIVVQANLKDSRLFCSVEALQAIPPVEPAVDLSTQTEKPPEHPRKKTTHHRVHVSSATAR